MNKKAFLLALTTYLLWGLFPLYFFMLKNVPAPEVIVHRAFWGLVTCVVVLALTGRLRSLQYTWRDRKTLIRLTIAGFLIGMNWTVYVYAVQTGRTVDAALGYFINPILTVLLGVVFLRERLTRWQLWALGLGVAAIAVTVAGTGSIPWVALALPVTFALYSYAKKGVPASTPAVTGMAIETAAIVPVLGLYMLYLVMHGEDVFSRLLAAGASEAALLAQALLLVGAGVITMIPLVTFAVAARHLPLSIMGMTQYVSPIMQLLIGVFVFHEEMALSRWIATLMVWLALVLLTVDSLKRSPSTRLVAK